jgi:hypothetical protein
MAIFRQFLAGYFGNILIVTNLMRTSRANIDGWSTMRTLLTAIKRGVWAGLWESRERQGFQRSHVILHRVIEDVGL